MIRVPIRCCCNPRLVLGTVEVEANLFREGERIAFTWAVAVPGTVEACEGWYPCDGQRRELEVGQRQVRLERIELEVGLAREWPPTLGAGGLVRVSELALKSNDVPLEALRRIPSFVEINQLFKVGTFMGRRKEVCER